MRVVMYLESRLNTPSPAFSVISRFSPARTTMATSAVEVGDHAMHPVVAVGRLEQGVVACVLRLVRALEPEGGDPGGGVDQTGRQPLERELGLGRAPHGDAAAALFRGPQNAR